MEGNREGCGELGATVIVILEGGQHFGLAMTRLLAGARERRVASALADLGLSIRSLGKVGTDPLKVV
jgi:hypothetical protein